MSAKVEDDDDISILNSTNDNVNFSTFKRKLIDVYIPKYLNIDQETFNKLYDPTRFVEYTITRDSFLIPFVKSDEFKNINSQNSTLEDQNEDTILHYACQLKSVEFVKLLLKFGANPNIKNKENFTPVFEAIRSEDVEILKVLIDAGADINMIIHTTRGFLSWSSPLRYAYSRNSKAGVEMFTTLLFSGANPNIQDNITKETILHYVATRISTINIQFVKAIDILLNAGANANISDVNGNTPLNVIMNNRYAYFKPSLVVPLINATSKERLNTPNHEGKVPLHFLDVYDNYNFFVFNPYIGAQTEILASLLKAGANPEIPTPNGKTVLHMVARIGNLAGVKILLEAGVNEQIPDDYGFTSIDYATEKKHYDIVQLLLTTQHSMKSFEDDWMPRSLKDDNYSMASSSYGNNKRYFDD